MTERDLVAKKLALIETYVQELRTLASPAKIATDVRERRFVEHTLQIASNVLVHGFAAVDPAIVRDVVENRLGDLVDFVEAVRQRLTV